MALLREAPLRIAIALTAWLHVNDRLIGHLLTRQIRSAKGVSAEGRSMFDGKLLRRASVSPICCRIALCFMVRVALGADTSISDQPVTSSNADLMHVRCVAAAERAGRELGCFITGSTVLGKLPDEPLYWYLDTYTTREAAEKAKGKYSTVVESYAKIWLFTINNLHWNASGGQRVARVGPLPLVGASSYTAIYMEATFIPGMRSAVHRHSGPEAWYVLTGEQCLETPGHRMIVRAGESGIVPEGPPMMLVGTGTSKRQALVLVLHDSSKSMTSLAPDWKPEELCSEK
jgi:quercetin dioxygenase-like cupin family protein